MWGDRKASSLEDAEATILMDSSVKDVTFFSVLRYKNATFIFLNQIEPVLGLSLLFQ